MKKRLIIISITILVIIALVVIGIVIITKSSNNEKPEKIKETLSQINAEELQEKIIEKLKATPLNVNTKSIRTEFTSELLERGNDGDAIRFYYSLMFNNYSSEKDYVFAVYTDTNENDMELAIPCFKIEADSNGKFKNIISPANNSGSFAVGKNVWNAVKGVLKDEYNIDISNYSLGNGITGLSNEKPIAVMNYEADDFAKSVSDEIIKNTDIQYNYNAVRDFEISIQKFGIDTIE